MNGFREKYEDIKAAGAGIIEISVDNVPSQRAWAESLNGVPFPILADFHPKAAVCQAYGVYNEERGQAFRSAFLIDEQGVIRFSNTYAPGSVPTAEELLAEIAKL